jgi:hypothetical protein
MRLLTIGLLSAGLAVGACNGADTVENGSRPPQPVPAADTGRTTSSEPGAAADTNRLPVATDGTSNAAETARRVEWREVTIPAGTRLPVILETPVGSDTSRAEEPVRAHLARAISVNGQKALAEGSRLSGVVTEATESARVKGLAHVSVRFDTLVPTGDEERYNIQTATVVRTAPSTKKKDALEIGAPAAGGGIIGGILGGKKGAAVGTAVGGGGGTAVVLSTRGKEIHIPKGAALTLQLSQPLTVKVRS